MDAVTVKSKGQDLLEYLVPTRRPRVVFVELQFLLKASDFTEGSALFPAGPWPFQSFSKLDFDLPWPPEDRLVCLSCSSGGQYIRGTEAKTSKPCVIPAAFGLRLAFLRKGHDEPKPFQKHQQQRSSRARPQHTADIELCSSSPPVQPLLQF